MKKSFVASALAGKAGQELGADVLGLAWETASMEPDLSAEQREAFAALIAVSFLNSAQGSTRLPVGLGDSAALDELLGQLFPSDAEDLRRRITDFLFAPVGRALVGTTADEYKPFLLLGDHLYHQRMHLQEDRLVGALRAILVREPMPYGLPVLGGALANVLDVSSLALTGDQQYAVLSAVTAPCTVVSGGPGTGKTTIVVSILRMLRRLGVPMESVALAAPTGRAAYRMGEAVLRGLSQIPAPTAEDADVRARMPKPTTLHRLLGYSPGSGRFRHHDNNRLAAAFVIVDEASMIDLGMMDHLFRALGPHAQLVLLGDADQLPSVEAGAVLRDLVPQTFSAHDRWNSILRSPLPAGEPALHILGGSSVRLVTNFRMNPQDPSGRAILSVAQAVRQGESPRLFEPATDGAPLLARRYDPSALVFDQVEWLSVEQDGAARRKAGWGVAPALIPFLDRWHAERVRGLAGLDDLLAREFTYSTDGFQGADLEALATLFRHFESFRLLCATRVLNTGADAVNEYLRSLLPDAAASRGSFGIGEPILMQENDYESGLFNGDQGIVLRVKSDGRDAHPMAVFPREGAYFPLHLESLRARLRTAYATTVHKCQGSEYDYVAFLLPEEDMPLLTREILYTAVTRAKRSVILLGSEELLRSTISRAVQRFTGIREKLERPLVSP